MPFVRAFAIQDAAHGRTDPDDGLQTGTRSGAVGLRRIRHLLGVDPVEAQMHAGDDDRVAVEHPWNAVEDAGLCG